MKILFGHFKLISKYATPIFQSGLGPQETMVLKRKIYADKSDIFADRRGIHVGSKSGSGGVKHKNLAGQLSSG